jgi:hypothetical protein
VIILPIGIGLSIVAFTQFIRIGWVWWLSLLCALFPLLMATFFGLIGVVFSAMAVGAMFKIP